ncbi:MdtA/MuxA family multidrug efflux RND transporter periplasmic adaptor subunit [Aquirhabdus parva]|uniref:Multidrug transporter subunit MdtA n=1 Tax=Aquirhabdus parva TaxID=2283318 RepID=A0A345P788_9GAMM|nr:MdtA/MuxA family multidrug efflux RND transporter periplasmic adaptor subunit [Aquirhabdus parva]AXI03147.1 multidrug transporter subunit MdtA [Aquirhabdus parva]
MSIEPQPNSPSNLPSKAPQPAWKRWAKWALFVLIVVLIIGFTWRHFHPAGAANKAAGGQGKRGGPGMNQPMPVQTKVLTSGDLNVYIEALGSVVPRSSVTVHPRVDGELISVNFNEGQIVKKGDLLLQIDPRPYQVALTQAEGQLARDQAQLIGARQDLVRYQSLVKQGSVSQQQVDQQQALVKQYEGTVKSDQGQVDSARLNLTYSRVTAPVSGRLGLRQVDVGNIVHASDANGVVVINQFQPINVTYSIPEDNVQSVLKQVHNGKTLSVDALDRAQKNKLDSGVLKSLDNGIDATTGTLKLKAEFANTSENLYPNQFVNVRMLVETQHDVTLLPSAAIQRGAKGTFVFVVNGDSTVEARPVTLGSVDGDNTGVISGVKAGEQVVFDGADKLKDGGKVKVIQPQTGGEAQGAAGGGAHHGHRHQTAS